MGNAVIRAELIRGYVALPARRASASMDTICARQRPSSGRGYDARFAACSGVLPESVCHRRPLTLEQCPSPGRPFPPSGDGSSCHPVLGYAV